MRPQSREANGAIKSQLFGVRARLSDTAKQISDAEARGEFCSGLWRRRKMLEIEAGYLEHYTTEGSQN